MSARFPSAPLIDSRRRSSTLSRFPVYPPRLPPDVFPPGTAAGRGRPVSNIPAIRFIFRFWAETITSSE
jgi:hypothetical protein